MKILIPILLSSSLLIAQDSACELQDIQLEKKVSLGNKTPEYFFKPVPKIGEDDNRDEVSMIFGGGNYFLDMNTGKTSQMPGPYDGVPTPDGQFIVSPGEGDHIAFYNREKLKINSKPVLDDEDTGNALYGVYHSLGILNKEKKSNGDEIVTYRAITDTVTTGYGQNTLKYKEYTFKIGADGSKEFIKDNGKPKLICSNLGDNTLKTPILAKNGRMLSAYNEQTGTTIIYDVEVKPNGKSVCNVKKDMGFATSKMEFSPEGDKVVFAMNSLQTLPSEVDWYSSPPVDSHNMNVFVYDMKSDDLTKMTNKTIGNSYYPSFSNDGDTVVWLSQEVGANWSKDYFVERAAVDDGFKTKFVNMNEVKACKANEPFSINNLAIGKLWEAICSPLDEAMTVSALNAIPMSMDPSKCEALVRNNWKNVKDSTWPKGRELVFDEGRATKVLTKDEQDFYLNSFLALKEDDLVNTCKQLNKTADVTETDNVDIGEVEETEQDPLTACTQCHSNPEAGNYIPFNKPQELKKWKKKLILNVLTGNMPKNMPITDEHREKILDKLYQIEE